MSNQVSREEDPRGACHFHGNGDLPLCPISPTSHPFTSLNSLCFIAAAHTSQLNERRLLRQRTHLESVPPLHHSCFTLLGSTAPSLPLHCQHSFVPFPPPASPQKGRYLSIFSKAVTTKCIESNVCTVPDGCSFNLLFASRMVVDKRERKK